MTSCCGISCGLIFALVIQFIIFPNNGNNQVFCNMTNPLTHTEWFEGFLVAYYVDIGLHFFAAIFAVANLLKGTVFLRGI